MMCQPGIGGQLLSLRSLLVRRVTHSPCHQPASYLQHSPITHPVHSVYTDMVVIVRTLYQSCRLVHADLSEYNILYYKVRGYLGCGDKSVPIYTGIVMPECVTCQSLILLPLFCLRASCTSSTSPSPWTWTIPRP